MPLVPCRACGHQVDTSALACPSCGATDPAHKISRQRRNVIFTIIQLLVIAALLGWCGWYVANNFIPMVRELIARPPGEQGQYWRR